MRRAGLVDQRVSLVSRDQCRRTPLSRTLACG